MTEKKNFPAAVLIRGVRTIELPVNFRAKGSITKKGEEYDGIKVLNGPGKICRHFRVDKKLNGWDLTKGEKLWIERGVKIKKTQIKRSKRIGIDYAKHCRNYPWRFYL